MARSSSFLGFGAGLAEKGERPAQLPAGAIEDGGRFVQIAAMEQQHGNLDAAVRPLECHARVVPAALGDLSQAIGAALSALYKARS